MYQMIILKFKFSKLCLQVNEKSLFKVSKINYRIIILKLSSTENSWILIYFYLQILNNFESFAKLSKELEFSFV